MEYEKLERICKLLRCAPFSDWQQEVNGRVYTEKEGLRFYLSISREPRTEIEFQDHMMVGEGEDSSVENLRIPYEVRDAKLEVVDKETGLTIGSYEGGHDGLKNVYREIHASKTGMAAVEKEYGIATARARLDKMLGYEAEY